MPSRYPYSIQLWLWSSENNLFNGHVGVALARKEHLERVVDLTAWGQLIIVGGYKIRDLWMEAPDATPDFIMDFPLGSAKSWRLHKTHRFCT